MAESLVGMVVENATKLLQQESELLSGVEDNVRELRSALLIIQGYLRDAEEKQLKEEAVRHWLQELKDMAYEVDDILDEYATEVMRMEDRRKSMNKVRRTLSRLNPEHVAFRHGIAKKLKDAQGRLDKITSRRNNFGLQERVAEGRPEVLPDRATGFVVDERKVYGREEDKEKIVKCLTEDASSSDDLFVYPILGEGGLGKTTLAQMIFNDDRIKGYFEPRIWVCVPEQSTQGGDNVSEDFDVKAVMSAIIRLASGNQSKAKAYYADTKFDLSEDKINATKLKEKGISTSADDQSTSNLANLQMEVQQLLKEKRYLLILDDVWNLNEDKWNQLRNTLTCGSKGASVVTTTRLEKTVEIMGTCSPHCLFGLRDDDCWLLFKQQAFLNDEVISPNIKRIALEIARKCNGVPIVAKTLGGLLRSKRSESTWENIRDTELWRLSEAANSILPVLRLSYWNLPPHTKQCFAFCAIFPKGCEIDTASLIRLWRANGFISSSGTLEATEVGNQICNELASRSLFQDLSMDGGEISSFKMHDLVHDLAQSIMKDESLIFDEESSYKAGRQIRHMNFQKCSKPASILNALEKAKSLRTLLINPKVQYDNRMNFGDSLSFPKFQKVRAVVAKSIVLKTVSPSIGNLKLLRHLDFSYSDINVLPETICDLWHLQTLDLTDCDYLQKLPDHMNRLKNLWDLFLDRCLSLESMPPRLREITGLKTLSLFAVKEIEGCGLSELEDLNLKGTLHINRLERVTNWTDAERVHMCGKKDLFDLVFSWDLFCESSNDMQVLGALKPHFNLERLEINRYKGAKLPLWMGNPVYNKLVSIKLTNLENCLELSFLGKLPSLKKLGLYVMNCMKYIDNEDKIHDEGAQIFPSLEDLDITSSKNLESLSAKEEGEIFPRLTSIRILSCPKLTLPRLPSIRNLDAVSGTNSFLVSVSNLSNLTHLSITGSYKIMKDLMYLRRSIVGRISFPGEMFINLAAIRSLKIEHFTYLEVPSNGMINLTALEDLEISDCSDLEDFPALGPLTPLQTLRLSFCEKLRSLPTDIQDNTTLSFLRIEGCPKLKKRYNKENGTDRHKISRIPEVYIS